MALIPNFSASESLANPNEITLTDTSTGTDGTITTRRVYILLSNGNWLTASGESTTIAYTTWNYSDSSIVLNVLSGSTACDIVVEWYAGATLTYTKTIAFYFNLYDYLFGLQLLQGNTSSPSQVQDANYYNNLIQFIVNIFNEENAIVYGSDIFSSQGAMGRNALLIQNEQLFF